MWRWIDPWQLCRIIVPLLSQHSQWGVFIMTIEYYSIIVVIPKEGLTLGWAGASQAFFWYDNNKDLKACFNMIRLISLLKQP